LEPWGLVIGATRVDATPLFFALSAHNLTDVSPAIQPTQREVINLSVGSGTDIRLRRGPLRLFDAVSKGTAFSDVAFDAYEGGDDPASVPTVG